MKHLNNNSTLYLVVPCYNEEAVIQKTADTLEKKIQSLINEKVIAQDSKIVFVNDGSNDNTEHMLYELYEVNDKVVVVSFTRNYGHQNALIAGLMYAKDYADVTITIDADLQQDVNAIDKFMEEYYKGNEIVYGIRNSRKTDGFLKKITALLFYRTMKLLGCDVIKNHADYRLLSKNAIEYLAAFEERNIFLRGLIPQCGLQSSIVYFDVSDREAGESKYTWKKMFSFAADGITSFSIKPMRLIMAMGSLFFCISICLILYYVIAHFNGQTINGWTSIAVSLWMLGGLQLLSIGCVGEYVGKTYMETKKRPRYLIKTILDSKGENE